MIDSREISDLHPTLQRGAAELIKRMKNKGYPVGISSTYRDNEKQNALYAQGRTTPGNIVTNAKGGESIHNYRLAFDIFENIPGEAYSDNTFFTTAGSIWETMGGEWGGEWISFVDKPHMQYTGGLTLSELQKGAALPENSIMLWESAAAIKTLDEALSRMNSFGIINSPKYWQDASNYIQYLELFLINCANVVGKSKKNDDTDPLAAVEKIYQTGAIASPEYWSQLINKLKYFPTLLVSIANYLE